MYFDRIHMALLFQKHEYVEDWLSGYTNYLRPVARTIETTSTQHQNPNFPLADLLWDYSKQDKAQKILQDECGIWFQALASFLLQELVSMLLSHDN